MKNRITTLILLVLAVQLTFAQVKREYQDEVFSQTTVVVKHDKASDKEVLNQYDLDDIGMDQVIRITTEDVVVEEPNSNPAPQIKQPEEKPVVSKPVIPVVPEVAPEDRKPKARRWAKRPKKKEVQKEKKQEESVAVAPPEEKRERLNKGGKAERESKTRSSKKVRSNKSVRKASKKKKRKKRKFKKAKRKKFKKKNKYSCYSF